MIRRIGKAFIGMLVMVLAIVLLSHFIWSLVAPLLPVLLGVGLLLFFLAAIFKIITH